MDKTLLEAIETESIRLGIDLKLLATKFALEYKKYFTPTKLKRIDFNKIDSFKDTKLDLTKNATLTVAEKKMIAFNEFFSLYHDQNTYMEINLREEVKKLVINSKQINLIYNFNIYDLAETLKEEYGLRISLSEYKKYQKELYIKSLIYNYVYSILFNESNKEYDHIIVGMFKNAYFDIISIYDNSLPQKKDR